MKINVLSLMTIVLLCIQSFGAFALVDYSDTSGSDSQRNRFNKRSLNKARQKQRPSTQSTIASRSTNNSSRSSNSISGISFSSGVQTLNIDAQGERPAGKVHQLNFNLEYLTPVNIFFKGKYNMSYSDKSYLSKNSSYQSGNVELILGLNWLKFGSVYDQGVLNFYGGASIGNKNSEFAHGRTDQIYGLETVKRFMDFAFGLGYEFRITGKSQSEFDIGNVGKLHAVLGWQVSNDIKIAFEAATVNIKSGNGGSKSINNSLNYSYYISKLQLGLSPLVNLNLKALFNINRASNTDGINAKLWNQEGLFGNTLSAHFSISI